MTVTSAANGRLLPKREAMKSAIEVMRLTLLMRMILRIKNQPSTKVSVGPM